MSKSHGVSHPFAPALPLLRMFPAGVYKAFDGNLYKKWPTLCIGSERCQIFAGFSFREILSRETKGRPRLGAAAQKATHSPLLAVPSSTTFRGSGHRKPNLRRPTVPQLLPLTGRRCGDMPRCPRCPRRMMV